MSNDEIVRVLIEIKGKLEHIDTTLEDMKDGLSNDRSNLWKVLTITIVGAFALVGVRLVFP